MEGFTLSESSAKGEERGVVLGGGVGVKEGVVEVADGGVEVADGRVGIRGSTEGVLGFFSVEEIDEEGFIDGRGFEEEATPLDGVKGVGGVVLGGGVGVEEGDDFGSKTLGLILVDGSVTLFMNFFY